MPNIIFYFLLRFLLFCNNIKIDLVLETKAAKKHPLKYFYYIKKLVHQYNIIKKHEYFTLNESLLSPSYFQLARAEFRSK